MFDENAFPVNSHTLELHEKNGTIERMNIIVLEIAKIKINKIYMAKHF